MGLTHWVSRFYHWTPQSYLMIPRGAIVKHELLCSHKPSRKDGGNGRRKLCVQKGSSGRCWGFKPGSKSCLSVNELQNSCGALGFWRSQARVSLLQPFGHNTTIKILCGDMWKKVPITFCIDGAAREWHLKSLRECTMDLTCQDDPLGGQKATNTSLLLYVFASCVWDSHRATVWL